VRPPANEISRSRDEPPKIIPTESLLFKSLLIIYFLQRKTIEPKRFAIKIAKSEYVATIDC